MNTLALHQPQVLDLYNPQPLVATRRRQLPVLYDKRPDGIVLSASQIDRWDMCKRWWAWEYLLGLKGPPHPSALLGTEVHQQLEAWLRFATPPGTNAVTARQIKAAAIAQKMIKHLPPPGSGVVERRFWFTTSRGHTYTGFIDWSGWMQHLREVAPNVFESMWLPTINDHKTTSNLEYAKTESGLHNDIQAVLYAIVGFVGFDTDQLCLFWDYGTTKDKIPQTQPIKTLVALEDVFEKFDNVVEVVAAELIHLHRVRPHPMSFPATVSACSAFGGCPNRQRCNITDQERLMASMNGPQQPSMAEMMQQFPTNGAGHQQPPQFPPPQQPAFQPPPQAAPLQMLPPPGYAQQPQQQPQQYTHQPQQPQYVQQPPQGQPQFVSGPQPVPQTQTGAQPYAQQPPSYDPSGQPAYPGQQPSFQPPQLPPAPQNPPAQGYQAQTLPTGAYAPHVAPNPPESNAAGMPAAPEETKTKRGKGRPAGSPNKELGLEGEIFMGGVYAVMSNSSFNAGHSDHLVQAGNLALEAYRKKFG